MVYERFKRFSSGSDFVVDNELFKICKVKKLM